MNAFSNTSYLFRVRKPEPPTSLVSHAQTEHLAEECHLNKNTWWSSNILQKQKFCLLAKFPPPQKKCVIRFERGLRQGEQRICHTRIYMY